jgi:hypothetical protein
MQTANMVNEIVFDALIANPIFFSYSRLYVVTSHTTTYRTGQGLRVPGG